jgi:hypothetical protein
MILAVWVAWLPPPASRWYVGLGNAQFLEEDVAHFPVVVLAGVDDRKSKRSARACRARTMGAIFMKLGRAPATR